MTGKQLEEEEEKINLKNERVLEEYDLEVLVDVENIEKSIVELKTLAESIVLQDYVESYESIRVEVKKNFGSDEYVKVTNTLTCIKIMKVVSER